MAQWTTQLKSTLWPSAASKTSLPDSLLNDTDEDSARQRSSSSSPLTLTSSSSPSPESSSPATPLQTTYQTNMPTTSPINIAASARNASSSPSSQATKLSKYHGAEDSRTSAMMSAGGLDAKLGRNQDESIGAAKPISMNNPNRNADSRPRRESLAGSLVGGMSWGGVSVGSWIRDDIIMTGTSPFPYQSPSYHSSSYLPKLEANFMRDFSCCGMTLPTLHDLLQHYEESHAQQTSQSLRTGSPARQVKEVPQPNSKAAIASQAASAVQQQAQQQQRQQQQQSNRSQSCGIKIGQPVTGASSLTGGIQRLRQQQQAQPPASAQQTVQTVDDEMDEVEDMEMDEVGPLNSAPETPSVTQRSGQQAQPSLFGQPQRPTLNLANSTSMLHQGLRTSQPTTPASSGFNFQNNPTVSSVNTPTLTTQPVQQQNQSFSPDSSISDTPADMDEDYNNMAMNMNLGNANPSRTNMNLGYGFGNGDLGLDLCIDEPAKRLFNPNGGFSNQGNMLQQFASFGLGGQLGNEDLIRRYQQQQMLQYQAFQNSPVSVTVSEDHKQFRCPVIGCEKAYKNQNGLKYHKVHGHQRQQLHENGDGTYSIVNPETSAPYPGTLGMEKEKPYKCDNCGKRYKNLNGLKYHKQHSPPCNPEFKLNGHLQAVGLGGIGVNVAGLPGIGEEMM